MKLKICSQFYDNTRNFIKFEKKGCRMINVLTPEQVRQADDTAIKKYNIPSLILMENAARSIAELIKTLIGDETYFPPKIAVFCGVGNNGGDGYALARHLVDYGDVFVYWIGDSKKMSSETKQNFDILSNLGIELKHITNNDHIILIEDDYDIIIDALIGVGGTENLKGIVVDLLQKINSLKGIKIAVDVPTGLNASTGKAHPNTFVADYTVTMFAIKTGMVIGDGPEFCGNIVIGRLGAPQSIVNEMCNTYILEKNDFWTNLPFRWRNSSKFDYGKVLVVAGSHKMPGAAALVANSAIKNGAGLVYLFTPKIHPQILPEVIAFEAKSNQLETFTLENLSEIIDLGKKVNSIVVGPGIQINDETERFVAELIKKFSKDTPILLDADAITSNLQNLKLNNNVLITPHIGEFSRLTDIPREDISKNPIYYAQQWANKLGCNILLKGPTTIITNGNRTFLNNYGSPALATAGSGDVLSGIIASFVAQGKDIFVAGVIGAYLHSLVGEIYEKNYFNRGLTASKIVDLIEVVYNELAKEINGE